MKHPNARRILCAVMILLLMAGLFAVLGFIGRRTDLSYAKELCSQRIDGVASSVSDLIGTYTRVFYNYENVLRTNAALSALPLEETLREQGDGAIRMYRNGCIVRLDGDELIIPQNVQMPMMDAADFLDENGAPLPYGKFQTSYEDDEDPEIEDWQRSSDFDNVGYFFSMDNGYYYVDFTSMDTMLAYMNAHGTLADSLLKLERVTADPSSRFRMRMARLPMLRAFSPMK